MKAFTKQNHKIHEIFVNFFPNKLELTFFSCFITTLQFCFHHQTRFLFAFACSPKGITSCLSSILAFKRGFGSPTISVCNALSGRQITFCFIIHKVGEFSLGKWLTIVGRVNDGLPLSQGQGARYVNIENDNFSSNYKQQAEFILKEISRGGLPLPKMTIPVDRLSFKYPFLFSKLCKN